VVFVSRAGGPLLTEGSPPGRWSYLWEVTCPSRGGQLRATAVSLTGGLAADLLSKVHGSLGFFGAKGVTTSQGLTDVNLQEVEMKAAMASVCERVIAVVDHTNLGQVGLATFVPLQALSLVITDSAADRGLVAKLEVAGVEVQLV
jgi:DeoR/GlpR family transcriptional regulator of sugar metabolism